jgi:methyl-accepting chemotaxis protein
VSIAVVRGIAGPISGLTVAMRKLADGDTAEMPARHRRDEIGIMAQSVAVFRDKIIEADRLRGEQDDLKVAAAAAAAAEKKILFSQMVDEFESGVRELINKLGADSGVMRATAHNMASIAREASQQTTSIASAAEEASANVGTVASATEELSASVGEIGRLVGQ